MQFGPAFILFIVFLILKLCGVIAWSWVWVTAPLWITFILTLVCLVLFGAGAALLVRKVNRP